MYTSEYLHFPNIVEMKSWSPFLFDTRLFFFFFPVCDEKKQNMGKAEWQIKALAMKLGEAFTCQESSSRPDRQCRLRSSALWSRLQKPLVYWTVRFCSVGSCVHRVLTISAIICLKRHAKWCLCPPLHFCIKFIIFFFYSDQHKQAWNLFCPPLEKKNGKHSSPSIQLRGWGKRESDLCFAALLRLFRKKVLFAVGRRRHSSLI